MSLLKGNTYLVTGTTDEIKAVLRKIYVQIVSRPSANQVIVVIPPEDMGDFQEDLEGINMKKVEI